MADEDENLVVSLDPEVTPGEGGGEGAATTAATGTESVSPPVAGTEKKVEGTGLEDLQAQIKAERDRNARAGEENRRLSEERDRAVAFAQDAERRGISTAEVQVESEIASHDAQLEALETQTAAAMEAGDFKEVAKLNRRMNEAATRKAILGEKKVYIATQREAAARRPAATTTPRSDAGAQPGWSEPTKQFLAKHPELLRSDGTLKRAALDGHEAALDAGYTADTPAYFEAVEKHLAGTSVARGYEAPATTRRADPGTAAPVERGAPVGSARGDTFTMTPKMRRLAEEQGVSAKDWAINYVRLLKEGRITAITG